MRFTNPVGMRGIRVAILRAVPIWSGFEGNDSGHSKGSLPYRPAASVEFAKLMHLKSIEACKSLSLFVCIPNSSLRLQTLSRNTSRYGGETEPTGAADCRERQFLGIEAQMA